MQVTWTIKENQVSSLGGFLKNQGFSRKLLTKLKQEPDGSVSVNNQPSKLNEGLSLGDHVQVTLPKETANPHLVAKPGQLDIVYEDTYLIILNKKAHQSSLPAHNNREHSLANELLHYFRATGEANLRIHPVSRLDKNTSGLIIFAKHQYIHHLLIDRSNIKKVYRAFISGKIEPKEGVIDYPIGRAPHSIIERQVTPGGKPAQTAYQLVTEGRQGAELEVDLLTGRTHQIRVHFAHLGHPLLGDDLYGGSTDLIDRHALHCHKLSLMHPITGDLLEIQAPLSADLRQLRLNF